ncbi:MAG TPA: PAS domain-containing protein [Gemmatimonadales bacterium]|jgi:hypothetical protein|nr:PAS domain-containing protein [Gemmatimonadales bacterium]
MMASWPALHPEMAQRSQHWASANAESLEAELAGYVEQASDPSCTVRVFWKLGPRFLFAGCNEHFARDAGMPRAELLGRDDFDTKLPWSRQAAKYRSDDEAVFASGAPKLDIIERQRGTTGAITWVRAGKAPIRTSQGTIGILGMYELLDDATGRRLFAEQSGRGRRAKWLWTSLGE